MSMDLHCMSLSMWLFINKLNQVIWLAENWKWAWYLNLFSIRKGFFRKKKKQTQMSTPPTPPELSFCRWHVLSSCSTKYHQSIVKGFRVTEWTQNQILTQEGEITPKVKKPELSILYPTHLLVLFYISTKYHQNIPKGIRVKERTQNHILTRKGGNTKSKKAKVVFLVRDMSSCPVLHLYQVS